ncbi:MAG: M28 family peptidase [Syntrophotaleaceae bacterium]
MEELLAEISTARIKDHIAHLEGVRHPQAAPDNLEQAALYIETCLRGYGYDVERQPFFDNGEEYRNLLATLPGSEQPEKRLLVVAHYDTVAVSPGADDNASGVAVLLELARVLHNSGPALTLQFAAVNLEENERLDPPTGSGLRGSSALAKHAADQGWLINGVIVLESVAYAGPQAVQTAPKGLPLEVPETGDFIAVIGNTLSAGLVQSFLQAADRHQPDLPKLPLIVPGNGEVVPDTRRSDHAPFWDGGYPAIMLTDTTNFRNPHYHTPGDTLDTLNLDFATAVCRATAGLILKLTGD